MTRKRTPKTNANAVSNAVANPKPSDAKAAQNPAVQPQPALNYNGGPLLTNVQLHAVYWGDWWNTTTGKSQRGTMDIFLQHLVKSKFVTDLAQFSRPGMTIGPGVHVISVVLTGANVTSEISDEAMRTKITETISGNAALTVTANSLYLVLTPPGVVISNHDGETSTDGICGYHWVIPDDPELALEAADRIVYAVVPYPSGECLGGQVRFRAHTRIISHEIAEAITDPVPGKGWYGDDGEIADGAAQGVIQDGYLVSKIWTQNTAQALE
jgi:hypothetical protein